MLIKSILAASIIAAACVPAFAQDNPPPPPKPGVEHAPPPGRGDGPPPPPPRPNDNAGFDVRLGRGAGLRVDCGKDPIKACVDAAMPLIDKAAAMMAQMPHDAPPPPPPEKKP